MTVFHRRIKACIDSFDQIGQLKQAIDTNDLARVKNLMTRNPELHQAPLGYAKNGPLTWVAECRLARAYWHGQSPLGQMLPLEIPVSSMADLGLLGTRPVVIGVVADTIMARLHDRGTFAGYEPLGPGSEKFAHLLIRVAPGAAGAINQASQRLRSIDPQADVRITSIAARLQREASRPRMLATLTGFVGIIAIVLCVIGPAG